MWLEIIPPTSVSLVWSVVGEARTRPGIDIFNWIVYINSDPGPLDFFWEDGTYLLSMT